MKLIVNADDFGRDIQTNDAIIGLARSGYITSSSLMANGPAAEEAVGNLHKCPGLSVGVHLNLTEFHPLTSSHDFGALRRCLNERGEFKGETFLRSISIDSALEEAIFEELLAQVNWLLSRGVRISHFDSHNHIHNIPGFFAILKRLQKHFGIRKVRTTWNIHGRQNQKKWSSRYQKMMWHYALRYYYRTVTTDGFCSLSDFIEAASTQNLPHKSVEVMVHPGDADHTEETSLLRTNWRERIFPQTTLINYDGL